jgi:UDPglucose 6-dehydrogenase
MGTTIDDFLNPEFVLLGVDDKEAGDRVKKFYKTIHDRPIYETSVKNAELIKVAYNTFIGMKIAYANTLMEICHKNGGDIDEVTGAIAMGNKRLISNMYLTGGMGDGGGCHPRDNIAMSHLAKKLNLSHNFFEDIMIAREKQTEFLADIINQYPPPYYIFGKTFKSGTNLTTGSPAILLANILKERNVEFEQFDPKVDEQMPSLKVGTYIVVTKHEEFQEIDYPQGSVVIDVWRYLKLKDGITHIKVGKQ